MTERHARTFSDEEIERIAAADPEVPLLTDEQLAQAIAVSASGRRKRPISIRIDEEVLDSYRNEGAGYQTRINEILCAERAGELLTIPHEWTSFFGRQATHGEVVRIVNEHIRREKARVLRRKHKGFVRASSARSRVVRRPDPAGGARWSNST
ncbi:MAG TPA: BrnA antitoxin family protein [Longimicrobium sp.]|jgi:uncharacterized protein (DUF4415 family)